MRFNVEVGIRISASVFVTLPFKQSCICTFMLYFLRQIKSSKRVFAFAFCAQNFVKITLSLSFILNAPPNLSWFSSSQYLLKNVTYVISSSVLQLPRRETQTLYLLYCQGITRGLTLRRLMSYIYIYIYMEHPFLMFLDHTQRRSTVGWTPLDE